jgi:hypothetical protein
MHSHVDGMDEELALVDGAVELVGGDVSVLGAVVGSVDADDTKLEVVIDELSDDWELGNAGRESKSANP